MYSCTYIWLQNTKHNYKLIKKVIDYLNFKLIFSEFTKMQDVYKRQMVLSTGLATSSRLFSPSTALY